MQPRGTKWGARLNALNCGTCIFTSSLRTRTLPYSSIPDKRKPCALLVVLKTQFSPGVRAHLYVLLTNVCLFNDISCSHVHVGAIELSGFVYNQCVCLFTVNCLRDVAVLCACEVAPNRDVGMWENDCREACR